MPFGCLVKNIDNHCLYSIFFLLISNSSVRQKYKNTKKTLDARFANQNGDDWYNQNFFKYLGVFSLTLLLVYCALKVPLFYRFYKLNLVIFELTSLFMSYLTKNGCTSRHII